MQVRIRWRRLELSEAERARIERRVRLALGARSGGIQRVDVTLLGGGDDAAPCRGRATVRPRLGEPRRAESEGTDPVDVAVRATQRAGRGREPWTEGGGGRSPSIPGLRA